ncbi:MAG: hypothetical protein KIT09_18225 [Bryobacteraceae bacterium]|nr:hypothetical protein [Bryobacteraceae bacterium]
MLDLSLSARIDEIAKDRAAGAAELALRAADALRLARADELGEAAQAIVRAQPAMASVYNAARAALGGRLEEFTERLRRSSEAIARKAAGLIRGKAVLTHSYSSTVARALREGGPSRVICTESLPGGEGRRTAALAGGDFIADAAVYSALADVDVVVVGADAVTPDAVINKVGTALMVLAARERGKPAWALCGVDKFVSSEWQPRLGELFEPTPRDWFTGIVDDSSAEPDQGG